MNDHVITVCLAETSSHIITSIIVKRLRRPNLHFSIVHCSMLHELLQFYTRKSPGYLPGSAVSADCGIATDFHFMKNGTPSSSNFNSISYKPNGNYYEARPLIFACRAPIRSCTPVARGSRKTHRSPTILRLKLAEFSDTLGHTTIISHLFGAMLHVAAWVAWQIAS